MKKLKKIKINLADIRQKWNNARLTKATAFWIVLGAVILTVYMGFSKAGWVTSATASQMAVFLRGPSLVFNCIQTSNGNCVVRQ